MSVSAKHKGTSYVAISLGKCTSGPGKKRFSPCAVHVVGALPVCQTFYLHNPVIYSVQFFELQ